MKLESFTAIPPAIMTDKSINQSQKLIYGVILGFALNSKRCFASNKYLGDAVGISEETTRQLLKSLEEKGFIIRAYTNDSKTSRAELKPVLQQISKGVVENNQGGGGKQPHTILDTILDISKDIVPDKEVVNSPSLKRKPNTKWLGIKEFKEVLVETYPTKPGGINDEFAMRNLRRVLTKNKTYQHLDDDMTVNLKSFLKDYLKAQPNREYLVRSVNKLKDTAKDWRDRAGVFGKMKQEKSAFASGKWI